MNMRRKIADLGVSNPSWICDPDIPAAPTRDKWFVYHYGDVVYFIPPIGGMYLMLTYEQALGFARWLAVSRFGSFAWRSTRPDLPDVDDDLEGLPSLLSRFRPGLATRVRNHYVLH